jgi:hypothetical protein
MSFPRVCGPVVGKHHTQFMGGTIIVSRGTLGYSLHSACMSFKRSGATGTWPGTNLNYNCEQVGIHPKFGAAVESRAWRT